MKAYQFNNYNLFIGEIECEQVGEEYVLPPRSTFIKPFNELTIYFTGTSWITEAQLKQMLVSNTRCQIEVYRWIVDRHNDQKVLNLPTTFTDNQIIILLLYFQDLRDYCNNYNFTAPEELPAIPEPFVAYNSPLPWPLLPILN